MICETLITMNQSEYSFKKNNMTETNDQKINKIANSSEYFIVII